MTLSLVKINDLTPLLTDTLPQEVPFFFSNERIYISLKEAYDSYIKTQNRKKAKGQKGHSKDISLVDFFEKEYFKKSKNKKLQYLIKKACSFEGAASIPYEYRIKNADKGHRNISLIHPVAQIKICDFYEKYRNIILFYCGKSSYSIRYPSKVSSRMATKSICPSNSKKTEVADSHDEDREDASLIRVPSSYFVLEKYVMLYKFYDSPEMLDLEKKFLKCRRVDIQRCFESIYTHSISWAVKDKEYTKKNLRVFSKAKTKSFEHEFDKLMQFSNYNETHSIPIGAETSRLFSEIILQKIDLNIQRRMEDISVDGRMPIKGRDFDIKRYMDDFFIFTNDERLSESIQAVCEDALKDYKLFINESKTTSVDRPFITSTSLAKQNVGTLLSKYLDSFELQKDMSDASKHLSVYRGSLQVINKIRGVIRAHKLSFYDVSNITLWILKESLHDTYCRILEQKRLPKQKKREKIFVSKIPGYLKSVTDVAFYIFHLSARSHTASTMFKICYIILEILKLIDNAELTGEIKQELFSKILIFCEKISHSQDERIFEFLDMVLFLDELGDDFKIKADRLEEIFDIENREKASLSYFEIIVLLSYIKKCPSYNEIKKIIFKSCDKKLSSEDALKKTENFLLFFDLIKCPHLEKAEKEKILGHVGISLDEGDVISFIEQRGWFFDWDKPRNLNIHRVLETKEAHLGY